MSYKFTTTKASDASHKRLTALIYGESGIGKTSLVKTLNVTDDSKVFYIAADPGQLVFRDRNFIVAEAPNGDWNEAVMDSIYDYLLHNGKDYEWIIVDGLDELGEAVLKSKAKTQKDMRKVYGEMGDYMASWTKHMRDLKGTSSLFITHIARSQDETGAMFFGPSFPGNKVTDQLVDWFDVVGCMRAVKSEVGVERLIQFKPEADLRFKVKDRSSVLVDFEKPSLGEIFARVHAAGFEIKEAPIEMASAEDLVTMARKAAAKGITRNDIVEYLNGGDLSSLTKADYEKVIAYIETK